MVKKEQRIKYCKRFVRQFEHKEEAAFPRLVATVNNTLIRLFGPETKFDMRYTYHIRCTLDISSINYMRSLNSIYIYDRHFFLYLYLYGAVCNVALRSTFAVYNLMRPE